MTKKWIIQNKEKENSYQKLKRSPEESTQKHTETYSKYFDGYRHLSQSEENECMWTHATDGDALLIEKDICDHQNISIKFLCVYVCLSYGDLFNF